MAERVRVGHATASHEAAADHFAISTLARRRTPALLGPSQQGLFRRSVPDAGRLLPPHLVHELDALRGAGEAIPVNLREPYQARLGHDFSRVRVHTGTRASGLNALLGATAFTVGREVVLGDQRSLATAHTSGVLAHELAHVAQLGGRPGLVLRQQQAPARAVIAAGSAERREFVQGTIHFLESSADHFALVTEVPPVAHILGRWRQMVEGQSRTVLEDLHPDPALLQALRAAYEHALTTLIETAARLQRRPVTALYEEQRANILEWAFPTQQVAGITTPLPVEAQIDVGGQAALALGGLRVIFLPDGRRAAAGAETTFAFNDYQIRARTRNGRVVSFTGPGERHIRIQTVYGPAVSAHTPSGYGRGTTREDVAAGETSLGFHEGQHGRDFLRFIRGHPYPMFSGQVGMTVADFRAAMADYDNDVVQYAADLTRESLRETDCVGTTLDQYNVRQGIRARIVCP